MDFSLVGSEMDVVCLSLGLLSGTDCTAGGRWTARFNPVRPTADGRCLLFLGKLRVLWSFFPLLKLFCAVLCHL